MDRKSIEQMKLDRRLVGRPNWISRKDLEKELEALPDVSHKIASEDDTPSDSSDDDGLEPDSGTGESFS